VLEIAERGPLAFHIATDGNMLLLVTSVTPEHSRCKRSPIQLGCLCVDLSGRWARESWCSCYADASRIGGTRKEPWLVRCHISLNFPQYAGSSGGRYLVQMSLTMSNCTQLKTWISKETKERFAAVARHQGMSESAMLKRLVDLMLQTAGAGEALAIHADRPSARGSRLTVRLRADDQALLQERATSRTG
jgi:hypothetical protein